MTASLKSPRDSKKNNPVKFIIALSISLALVCQAFSQEISLEEILDRTTEAIKIEDNRKKASVFEFTEKIIFSKLNKKGECEDVDTVISRVRMKGDEELSREILYSSSDEDTKKKKKKESKAQIKTAFSIDDPDYSYELLEETEDAYIVSITPRKKKPDKGQIKGKIYIDKDSFLIKTMDFIVPRPEKLKELSMRFELARLDNGLYVVSDMRMNGYVKFLFGVVKFRFRVEGEFCDYAVCE